MISYIFLVLAFTLNSLANILLKVKAIDGFSYKNQNLMQIVTNNYHFFLALFLFALNVVFYFLALKNLPLSVSYPIMAVMCFIIVNCYSYLYIKEPINWLQIIGYFFVLTGLFLIVFFAKKNS